MSDSLIETIAELELVLGVALSAALAWGIITSRRRWYGPLARIQELVPRVRQGVEPIESLNQVGGGLTAVAAICQELLRDIRKEQARIAQLEQEVRQRIATRTEALERRIGALQQQAARDGLTGLL